MKHTGKNAQLLQEVMTALPQLKELESDVAKFLDGLIAARPDVTLTDDIKASLRETFQSKLVSHGYAQRQIWRRRAAWAGTGFLFCGLAVGVLTPLVAPTNPEVGKIVALVQRTMQPTAAPIYTTGSLAFGDQIFVPSTEAGGKGGGGGVSAGNEMAVSAVANDASGEIAPVSAKMIAPYEQPDRVSFHYSGSLSLSGTGMVFRRMHGEGQDFSPFQDFGILGQMFDARRLGALKLNMLSVVTPGDMGYMIDYNFTDRTVSVSQNWQTWPNIYDKCQNVMNDNGACYQSLQLKEADMLSEQEALSIADNFLIQMGFPLTGYGKPVVQMNWKKDLETFTGDKKDFYFPDQVTVIYPQIVDGLPVVNQWDGSPQGVNVTVDQRLKKATGMWSVPYPQYEASEYPMVTDEKAVLDMVARGGMSYVYMPYHDPSQPQRDPKDYKNVELGAPIKSLIRIDQYHANKSEEYYVPGLSFPILNARELGLYQENVVVPLAQKFFDEQVKILGQQDQNTTPEAPVEETPANTDTQSGDTVIVETGSIVDSWSFVPETSVTGAEVRIMRATE